MVDVLGWSWSYCLESYADVQRHFSVYCGSKSSTLYKVSCGNLWNAQPPIINWTLLSKPWPGSWTLTYSKLGILVSTVFIWGAVMNLSGCLNYRCSQTSFKRLFCQWLNKYTQESLKVATRKRQYIEKQSGVFFCIEFVPRCMYLHVDNLLCSFINIVYNLARNWAPKVSIKAYAKTVHFILRCTGHFSKQLNKPKSMLNIKGKIFPHFVALTCLVTYFLILSCETYTSLSLGVSRQTLGPLHRE
jgi:hypothetical protein